MAPATGAITRSRRTPARAAVRRCPPGGRRPAAGGASTATGVACYDAAHGNCPDAGLLAVSDVTVVALSLGERYGERALASAQRQTLPPADIVVVRDVSPFHRALNAGAARVRTPFFVQLDADFTLDETCLAELRALMRDDAGMVAGLLRDPVVGRTMGIRLYRTACFAEVQIRDSISPDMDFTNDTARLGWIRVNAVHWRGAEPVAWHTFGDHRPDYTPLYTYAKFRLEGVRARYRRREDRARMMLRRLCPSPHPAAPLALIAMAHGFFHRDASDQLAPYRRTAEFDRVQAFLAARDDGRAPDPPSRAGDAAQRFRDAFAFGVACHQRPCPSAFLAHLDRLRRGGDPADALALVGLCHGLFDDELRPDRVADAWAALTEIL